MARRSWCRVIAPRSYTASWKMFAGPGSPGHDLPERIVRVGGVGEVEQLLGRALTDVLRPQPLGVGGEALVEPDVAPAATETESPNHWCASSCTTTYVLEPRRKKPAAYVGPGLVLQREAESSAARATPPSASNGYGPKTLDLPLDDLGGALDAGPGGALASSPRRVRVGVDHRLAVGRDVGDDLVLADRQEGQVGGLRLGRAPAPPGPAEQLGQRRPRHGRRC